MALLLAFVRRWKAHQEEARGEISKLGALIYSIHDALNYILATNDFIARVSWRIYNMPRPHRRYKSSNFSGDDSWPRGFSPRDFTAVIPIYGNLSLFSHLLDSLRSDIASGLSVVIVDDSCDPGTSSLLEGLLDEMPESVRLFKNASNEGYVASVNSALEAVLTPYAVLLNSDVEVSGSWLMRFAKALSQDRVALATALATNSGANLTLELPEHIDWREADRHLETLQAEYPDACTAIGYAMAVNLSLLGENALFSKDFVDGYGEDSDLHYRTLALGFRSVVVDNLLVFHASGASYSGKTGISQTKKMNQAIFAKRWGLIHSRQELLWQLRQPLRRLKEELRIWLTTMNLNADILLVAPTLSSFSGGVRILSDIRDEAGRRNVSLRVLDLSGPGYFRQRLTKHRFKLVVATGVGTFEAAERIASAQGIPLVVLLQGPEYCFENGAHAEVFGRIIRKADLVIALSEFLAEIPKSLGNFRVTVAPLGPDALSFYPSGAQRKKQIAISSRTQFEKGLVFLLPVLQKLFQQGWNLVSVGPTHPALYDLEFITNLGLIDSNSLRRVYSESQYLIDLSLFEGVGLVPLEAASCGTMPVVTRRGGSEQALQALGARFLPSGVGGVFQIPAIVSGEHPEVKDPQLPSRQECLENILLELQALLSESPSDLFSSKKRAKGSKK